MNNYETVFIVTPVLSDAQVKEVADKFQGIITENGGQIVNRISKLLQAPVLHIHDLTAVLGDDALEFVSNLLHLCV